MSEYDSGDIKKVKGVPRGFVARRHYIFRIRGKRNERYANTPITIEVHSSISRNALASGPRRSSWGYEYPAAATTLQLSRDEALHLVSATLAALEEPHG